MANGNMFGMELIQQRNVVVALFSAVGIISNAFQMPHDCLLLDPPLSIWSTKMGLLYQVSISELLDPIH